MKTLKILALVLTLSGCIYAGDVSVLGFRDDYLADFSSYSIEFMDEKGPQLIKSETVTDSSFAANKLLTAYKGYPMVDTKSYSRNYYTQESIVAPSNAVLTSGLSPVSIEAKKKYDVIGRVDVEGKPYALVSVGFSKDVFLVENDGKLYNRIGVIRNDKLVLLDTSYNITPKDFKFEPVSSSKMVQSEIVKGFEVRYGGIKLGRVILTLMEYVPGNDAAGEFVDYNYPNRPGVVDLRGIKIKIFEANNSKIEYMIVNEK